MNKNSIFFGLLLMSYFFSRFIEINRLESLIPNSGYFLDLIYIGLSAFLLGGSSLRNAVTYRGLYFFATIFAIASGAVISFIAPNLGLIIPFDLKDPFTILMLLLLGPILEEWIFRYATQQGIKKIFHSRIISIVLSSFLFSIAHFVAYFSVPTEFQSFVIYQTIYTLLLGFGCGYAVIKNEGSIINAILIHMGFNFGFFLGAV
jgi:hypothetical protein